MTTINNATEPLSVNQFIKCTGVKTTTNQQIIIIGNALHLGQMVTSY